LHLSCLVAGIAVVVIVTAGGVSITLRM